MDIDSRFGPELDKLAKVIVHTGLALRAGQDLVVTAPVEALPLLRRVTAEAYRAGAGLVTPILSDSAGALARFRPAPDDSFDRAPGWLFDGMARAYEAGAARLAIVGDDPMLLSEENPEKVSRAGKAQSRAYKPALEKFHGKTPPGKRPDVFFGKVGRVRSKPPPVLQHPTTRKFIVAIPLMGIPGNGIPGRKKMGTPGSRPAPWGSVMFT